MCANTSRNRKWILYRLLYSFGSCLFFRVCGIQICNTKTIIFFNLGCQFLPQIKRKYDPKGVRLDHHDKKNNIRYIYSTGAKCLGVRTEKMIYYLVKKRINSYGLEYCNKPCVCGSLRHARTTHLDCMLNNRYDDD